MALSLLFVFAVMSLRGTGQHILRTSDPAVIRAGQLLNLSRPSEALGLLQPAVERHPGDPGVLMLAGLAAYRADQVRAALGYWRQSLDLAPSPTLQALYDDADREAAADRGNDKLYGQYVELRYDSAQIPVPAARSILTLLEAGYARLSVELGCRANEPIAAIVQTRAQYMRASGAAEWSGGYYDGRIHLVWSSRSNTAGSQEAGSQDDSRIGHSALHELVHACLAAIPSGGQPWPAWFQEGLAEKVTGDQLTPSAREQLRQLAQAHRLPRLSDLGPGWFTMPQSDAAIAYGISLAAVNALVDRHAGDIRGILREPESLLDATLDLDSAALSQFLTVR